MKLFMHVIVLSRVFVQKIIFYYYCESQKYGELDERNITKNPVL